MATAALQNVCFKATVSRPSVSQTRARSVVVCAVRPQDVAAHVAAAATAATLLVVRRSMLQIAASHAYKI